MAYCTQSEILDQMDEDVLIQLTDDDDAGVVDTDVVAQKIADADALIDGYCGGRYTVPFNPVPALISKFSVDIAIYNLYGRRKGAPEDRRNRFKEAIDFLKGVAAGNNSLGEDDPATGETSFKLSSSNPDRIFTRDKMSGF